MFKPTKKQHLVNKAYSDKNSGSGGTERLIVNIINGGGLFGDALDRTWQEIHDAFPNVILRKVHSDIVGEHESLYSVINVREEEGDDKTTYIVDSFQSSTAGFTIYSTDDPNGYPNGGGGGIF